jgi:hypothetical protein
MKQSFAKITELGLERSVGHHVTDGRLCGFVMAQSNRSFGSKRNHRLTD